MKSLYLGLILVLIFGFANGQNKPVTPPVKQTIQQPVKLNTQIKNLPDKVPDNSLISVSEPYTTTITGFQIGTAWAGYGDGQIVDMLKLSNGNIALAYTAGTDQGINYSRGLYVVLNPSMQQVGQPKIFSAENEHYIKKIKMFEYGPGKVIIGYDYEGYAEHGTIPSGTKWVALDENGEVDRRGTFGTNNEKVLDIVGMTMASNQSSGLSNVTLVFNTPDGIELRVLSDYEWSSNPEERCTLPKWQIPGAGNPKKLNGEWMIDFGDEILIKVKESLSLPEWAVASQGIRSGVKSSAALPFVVTNDWDLNNTCRYLNYPSAPSPNAEINPNKISHLIPLGNDFAVIQYEPEENSKLLIVDDKFKSKHQVYLLPQWVQEGSIQHQVMGDGRLLLYMTSRHMSTGRENKHHLCLYDPQTGIAMKSWGEPFRTSMDKESVEFPEFLVDHSSNKKLIIQLEDSYGEWNEQVLNYYILHYNPQ
jgi:hypothetical protein